MTDAERYAVSVRKVRVDDQEVWRATVRELPDLAEFAETREEALDLALDAIESLKASAAEEGRPFPEPIEDEEEYSGRVTLRMPKTLHRDIALQAEQEDVSVNSYMVIALARAVAVQTAMGQAPALQFPAAYSAGIPTGVPAYSAGTLTSVFLESGYVGYQQATSALNLSGVQTVKANVVSGTSATYRILEPEQPIFALRKMPPPEAAKERRRA